MNAACRTALIALVAAALAAPAASAAPVAQGTVSAASPVFSWEGTAYGFNLVGEPCNTDHSCEDALLAIETPGTLTIDWQATAPAGPAWLGVGLYESRPDGAEGKQVKDGGALADSGTLAAPVDKGYYLVRVAGLLTSTASYSAKATLEPDPESLAPAQAVAPATASAPPAAKPKPKAKPKKRSCKRKKGSKKSKSKRCKKKRKK